MKKEIIVQLHHISKSFPGVKALDDVSIEIEKGTVHALIGENGAGKSTLIKILAGIYEPDSGEIILNGDKVHFGAPIDAQQSGISVIHQEIKLSEPLTVTENIFMGNLMKTDRLKLVNWKQMREIATIKLRALNSNINPDATVDSLSVAEKQIVEICKAIASDAKIIIMDEPSATLSDRELKVLYQIIQKLRKEEFTIIYISHRMNEVFELADKISVLRDGCHVGTVKIGEATRETLIEMMVGRELNEEYIKHNCSISSDLILEARELTRKGSFYNVNLQVRYGEVLGISGLVGAGRTELARALVGIDRLDSGEIIYKGKNIKSGFRERIQSGIGFVPEDRKSQGLVLDFPIQTNITMVAVNKIIQDGIIRKNLETSYAKKYINKLKIATASLETEVQYLSGGNQQKVVISKWLMQDSELLILDEPTRGVDVGAKREIYTIIKELVEQGKTLIVISSEMPELIGICDRIVVMSQGKFVGEFQHDYATQEKILALCV